ncbi:MAG TPA: DinB family protein [Vicinamibacterales bacterium]|nr:DinB family protein [Vicinamibacterales bacterium]
MTNREFFLHICSSEFPRFAGVLQATPGDTLDYRPHPRSRSAQELIGHLIGHEQDLVELMDTGTINHRMQVPFRSIQEALEIYREAHEALKPKIAALDEGAWESVGQFYVGPTKIMEAPRRDLAWMLLFDAVHHRGQLSTYLRPMGGTVPSIYGPSADTMMAQA